MNKLFSKDIWLETLDKATEWVVTNLPLIILILLLWLISIKIYKASVRKIQNIVIKRVHKKAEADHLENEKRINTLAAIINQAGKLLISAIFLMLLLGRFGIDLAPLIAGAGIFGLAIGFGAQELVRDVISGFFILLENQIRAGDVAIINGTGGLIEKIELRTITMRDFEGVVHIFQNGKISSLSNRTKDWSAVVLDIGVAYKENTDKVIEIMQQVGKDLQEDENFIDSIREPLEIFGVDQFAASSVMIKARIKTHPGKQWPVGREYRRRLKYAFDAHDIEIPFPHTKIYMADMPAPSKILEKKEEVQQ